MGKKNKNKKFKRIENYIPESKTLNEKLKSLNIDEIKEIKPIDSRFKRLIVKFVNFLRNEDFTISTDALIKFFELYTEFDVFEIDDIKYTLKMLICKNREQYHSFEDCFDMFFYGLIDFNNMEAYNILKEQLIEARASDLIKEKEEKEKEFEEYQKQIELKKQEKIEEIKQNKNKIEEEKEKFIESSNIKDISQFRRRKEKGEAQLKEWADNNTDKIKEFLNKCKLNETQKEDAFKVLSLSQEKIIDLMCKEPDKKMNELRQILNTVMMDNLLEDNDPIINNLCLTSSNILMKSKNYVDKKLNEMKSELSKFDNSIREESNKLNSINKVMNQETEQKRKEIKEYDKKLNNISNEIEKEITIKHRPVFIEGNNSVKVNTNSDLLAKDIEKLSDKQYETLTEIIKANASKFKTKISRSMIKHKSKRFNYKKTMQNSIKTYGIPMELYYEKPKVKKTKIVCILDVSGSCAKSSKLLLRFIYELSNVFKGGVKSYAFVKDLTDISDFFVNYHINDAIEESLKSVPRTYSDYYTALKTFNNLYLGEVDKNTIVIFLGDARNNKNEPGLEFLSAIQKRAKSTIWLNTEEKPKWNVNDSVIGLYSEYMNDVREILTTNDIVKFLEGFKIK